MTFSSLVTQAVDVINLAVQVLGALALVLFMWAGVRYVRTSNEKDQSQSRTALLWGLVALFILVSIWGILRILRSTIS